MPVPGSENVSRRELGVALISLLLCAVAMLLEQLLALGKKLPDHHITINQAGLGPYAHFCLAPC